MKWTFSEPIVIDGVLSDPSAAIEVVALCPTASVLKRPVRAKRLVVVAFVLVLLVLVSPVMVATVAVKVSMIPVVKRANVEKKFVEVAFVAVAFVAEIPLAKVEDAETMSPIDVVGASAPPLISNPCPNEDPLPEIPRDDVATHCTPVPVDCNTWPEVPADDAPSYTFPPSAILVTLMFGNVDVAVVDVAVR